MLITPYTSCAARLTIYLMIAKIFFPDSAGTVVFGMYVGSIVLVVLGAWVLKQFITKHDAEAPLMLILPAYQVDSRARAAQSRSWIFIRARASYRGDVDGRWPGCYRQAAEAREVLCRPRSR